MERSSRVLLWRPVYVDQVHHVVSDKACATIIILPEQDTTIVCFRGTKVSDI
jgi:hypothetical protein